MANSGSFGNEDENILPPPHFVDPNQNPSSPFYIHPSESPSSVVVSPPRSANNFQSWYRSFRMALISKNKMGFLNGNIPIPATTDPLYPSWERCNTLLMSWILSSLSPSIAQSVVFFERAIDVWIDLRERFSQGDLIRVAELQEEIYLLKQGALSVTDFYAHLKSLWEELDNYQTLTPCSCSARTYHSQDFIIRFLKGLDDQFAMVRSQILLLDPLPSANRVFSMIIQHERQQHHPSSSMETNPFINVISGKGRGHPQQGGTKPTRKCEFCGRLRHTIDSDMCFTKFGYPPGHPKYPGKPRPFNNRNTFGSSGATAGGNVNNVTASSSSDVAPTLIHEGERKDVSTLGQGLHITMAQFQQLMSLLNKASGSGGGNSETPSRANLSHSNPNQSHTSGLGSRFISINTAHTLNNFSHTTPWVIDSGATDHITTSLEHFFEYSEINPLNINLPNGFTVQAHISGSIQFSPDFIIHDVLLVPNFIFNLLSLPKLLTTVPCRIIFSNEISNILCQIQDMNTLRMIGSANLKEGLFHLTIGKERNPSTNNTTTTINNSNLWHFRLGHLSSSRLNALNQKFPFISKDSHEICDICHLAKQKKLPYSPSSSRCSKIFELIHMDIWGPFSKTSIHGHKYFLTILDDFSRYTWVVLLKSKGENKVSPFSLKPQPPTLIPFHQKIQINHTPTSIVVPPPRRSKRDTHPPPYLSEYQYKLPSLKSAQSSTRCSHPIQRFISYTNISHSHHRFLMAISSEREPASFYEAVKLQCWRDAMQCEIKALELNHTWDVVETSPSVRPIGCKWVYKIKRFPDGSIERYTA
ncbi:hypothetical protein V8G54_028938 [Vigna mungo]|uniref:Retrovirus-related Pol polyprotein from transposon TNT 1-94 n=1 Tax=Vigna mungo TaxID=3915 RepID=A0AAQ3MT71_VIGMU